MTEQPSRGTPPAAPEPPTARYLLRGAEDVLAVVPVVLGFEPHDSVVMLTFGGRHGFHARVDLPPPAEVEGCVDALLAPARRHEVAAVLFVLYSDDDRRVRTVARALRRRFLAAGLDVKDVLQAFEGRWYTPLGGRGVPAHGVPYDVADHPFRARAVVDGRDVAASRRELAARLAPDPTAAAAVSRALGEVADETLRGPQLRGLLDAHLVARTTPSDVDAARVLLAILDPSVRDHAWFGMRRAEAVDHVRLWTDLVRRAPEGLAAGAAGVLAFAAWTSGDGALAWCAVDRCLADRPGHSLGRLVAEALERAVPPMEDWEERFPGGLAG